MHTRIFVPLESEIVELVLDYMFRNSNNGHKPSWRGGGGSGEGFMPSGSEGLLLAVTSGGEGRRLRDV